MLPTYPARLLDYAVDGVIQAASRHHAVDAERLAVFSRKAAAREREQARSEAIELRTAAMFEGYRDGMLQAFQAMSGLFEGLRGHQHEFQRALSDAIHADLREQALAPDAALLQLAAVLDAQREAQPGEEPVRLFVPRDQPQLAQALDAALEDVQVQLADRRHLVVEIGRMAFELDIGSALAEDIEARLATQMPDLRRAMCALSDRYALHMQQTLVEAAGTAGLLRLEQPDDAA